MIRRVLSGVVLGTLLVMLLVAAGAGYGIELLPYFPKLEHVSENHVAVVKGIFRVGPYATVHHRIVLPDISYIEMTLLQDFDISLDGKIAFSGEAFPLSSAGPGEKMEFLPGEKMEFLTKGDLLVSIQKDGHHLQSEPYASEIDVSTRWMPKVVEWKQEPGSFRWHAKLSARNAVLALPGAPERELGPGLSKLEILADVEPAAGYLSTGSHNETVCVSSALFRDGVVGSHIEKPLVRLDGEVSLTLEALPTLPSIGSSTQTPENFRYRRFSSRECGEISRSEDIAGPKWPKNFQTVFVLGPHELAPDQAISGEH